MSFWSLSAASRCLASMPAWASSVSALSLACVSNSRRLTFSAASTSCGDVGSDASREAYGSGAVLNIDNEYHHLSGSGHFFMPMIQPSDRYGAEPSDLRLLPISGRAKHFAHFCDDFGGLQRF